MNKRIVIIIIAVGVALLHLVTGDNYAGPFPLFVNGYLIDILLPMVLYLLLFNLKWEFFTRWYVKAGVVFTVGLAVETAQYFGVQLLGSTFDPLDYIMYAFGAGLGVVLDRVVFPHLFMFWESELEA
jgi:hypothetical protein